MFTNDLVEIGYIALPNGVLQVTQTRLVSIRSQAD